MSDNKYNELLHKYRSGTITDAERHKLEQAALDDPFLFDAMEGYATYGSTIDAQNLKEISDQHKTSGGKVRILNPRIMAVAASLVALLAITFVVKNQLSEDTINSTKVVQKTTPTNENLPMADAVSYGTSSEETMMLENTNTTNVSSEAEDNIDQEITLIDVQESTKNPISTATSKDHNSDNNIDVPSSPIKQINPPHQKVEKNKKIDHVLTEEKVAIEKNTDEYASSKSRSSVPASRPEKDAISYGESDTDVQHLLGKILDYNGNPIEGALVKIENTRITVYSDAMGNFKLPKYETGHQILVSNDGYQNQKILIGDQSFYQIVLRKTPAATETKSRLKEVDNNKAFPAMGIEEFDIYVSKHKQIPLEVFGSTEESVIEVSFDVNEEGSLSNFLNKTESCDECFVEAVRLLKASGKWNTLPANTAYKTSYTFRF